MSKWKVFIPDRVTSEPKVEMTVFGNQADVITLKAKSNDEIRGKIEEADAILAWHDLKWDRATLASLKNCRSLVRVGAGFDNVDLVAAKEFGIVISNVPDYGTNDVADPALALLLALARGLFPYAVQAKAKKTWVWEGPKTFRLTKRKLGIVGLGRIGAAFALRAKALGMTVSFYDPYLPIGWEKSLGLERHHDLLELARNSEIISLHTPLTVETRGMIGKAFFDALPQEAVLINTSRGPVMDWPAFREAFLEKKVYHAGFDVLPTEPIDDADPLLARWINGDPEITSRLIITPHCAFFSREAEDEMRYKAAMEALRVLRGERPRSQVNP